MSSQVIFSLAIFKDGTVEVQYAQEGSLKFYRLKPRNPVLMLLPLFSTLGLAMGSDILLRQEVKSLIHKMGQKE